MGCWSIALLCCLGAQQAAEISFSFTLHSLYVLNVLCPVGASTCTRCMNVGPSLLHTMNAIQEAAKQATQTRQQASECAITSLATSLCYKWSCSAAHEQSGRCNLLTAIPACSNCNFQNRAQPHHASRQKRTYLHINLMQMMPAGQLNSCSDAPAKSGDAIATAGQKRLQTDTNTLPLQQ